MADTVTSTSDLAVGLDYPNASGTGTKTVYLKIPNPMNNITESQIKSAVGTALTNKIFLNEYGDEIPTSAISTAYTENQTINNLDIGYSD